MIFWACPLRLVQGQESGIALICLERAGRWLALGSQRAITQPAWTFCWAGNLKTFWPKLGGSIIWTTWWERLSDLELSSSHDPHGLEDSVKRPWYLLTAEMKSMMPRLPGKISVEFVVAFWLEYGKKHNSAPGRTMLQSFAGLPVPFMCGFLEAPISGTPATLTSGGMFLKGASAWQTPLSATLCLGFLRRWTYKDHELTTQKYESHLSSNHHEQKILLLTGANSLRHGWSRSSTRSGLHCFGWSSSRFRLKCSMCLNWPMQWTYGAWPSRLHGWGPSGTFYGSRQSWWAISRQHQRALA